MIRTVLETIKDELKSFVDKRDTDGNNYQVSLSNLLDQEGKLAFTTTGSGASNHYLVLSLVSVEEERNLMAPPKVKKLPGNQIAKSNPEIHLNLYVLFTGYSTQYETALSLVAETVGFFQQKSYFDSKNTPQLPATVERIVADMHTLSFEQQNYMWGMLGAKYMPSALYKLRTITVDEDVATQIGKPVMQVEFET